MDSNNVVNIVGTDNTTLTTTGTGVSITADSNLLYNGNGFITSTVYNYGTTVKKAVNGYVVENGYQIYIAKNEKELTKVLMNILNPKQTKGVK